MEEIERKKTTWVKMIALETTQAIKLNLRPGLC